MTYLEVVNKVLLRLRETQVATVAENNYSALVGELVNVTKREIEDSWNWSCLRTTLTTTTTASLFNYVLVGSGTRFRVIDVVNDTTNIFLKNRPSAFFEQQFLMTTVQTGAPEFYNFNGVDTNGDSQVDVFPIPNAGYTLYFNIVMPQNDFTTDTEVVKIPYTLLIEGAISRALSERGEDGGYQDQEGRYRNMLADLIAIEAGTRPDETVWYPN